MTRRQNLLKSRIHMHPAYGVCLLLVLAVLMVYGQVKDHEFLSLDDPDYVSDNQQVKAGFTRNGFVWAWTTFHAANWHPLTWLSHMLDIALYGMNAGAHHITNLLFHILNALLVFHVLRRMTDRLWPSAMVAALFALHPLHVESVAWVAERKDVLSTFFWMLTLWGYLRYVEKPARFRYGWVVLCFTAGLTAKPMLVTLPFVLVLLDLWPLGRIHSRAISGVSLKTAILHSITEKIPLFILSAASGLITLAAQHSKGAVYSLQAFPPGIRIGNALMAYVKYLGLTLIPYQLTGFYPHPRVFPPLWQLAASVSILTAITVFAIRTVKARPYIFVGWFWYIGTLVPVIGLVQVGVQTMADRYTYVPLTGLFIILAWGGADVINKHPQWKPLSVAATLIILSMLTLATGLQIAHWRTNERFFTHMLQVTPDNYLAHHGLGGIMEKKDRLDDALFHYSTALRLMPNYAHAHINLGNVLAVQGKLSEAVNHYHSALAITPEDANAHYNLGIARVKQGRLDEAVRHFSAAMRLDPGDADVYNNLGVVLFRKGDIRAASFLYRKALALDAGFPEARQNLGVLLLGQGRFEEAIRHFQTVLKLDSNHPNASDYLKTALDQKNALEREIVALEKRIRQDPDNDGLHRRLGDLYKKSGKFEPAKHHYRRALAIDPQTISVLDPLAMIHAREGAYETAIFLFERIIAHNPDRADAYYKIAGVYARQNRIDESVTWLKKAIRNGFRNWNLLEADDNFDNLKRSIKYRSLMNGDSMRDGS